MDRCNEERINNIAIAATAMCDAGLSDEKIVYVLQKYWDLRKSETDNFIKWTHDHV